MNILRKIEDKTYQNADLINNIDLNPIVSYHIIKEIVKKCKSGMRKMKNV